VGWLACDGGAAACRWEATTAARAAVSSASTATSTPTAIGSTRRRAGSAETTCVFHADRTLDPDPLDARPGFTADTDDFQASRE
jgi:hypothetical protein